MCSSDCDARDLVSTLPVVSLRMQLVYLHDAIRELQLQCDRGSLLIERLSVLPVMFWYTVVSLG